MVSFATPDQDVSMVSFATPVQDVSFRVRFDEIVGDGWPHSSGIIIFAPFTVITRYVVDDWDVGILQQFHACNARSRCSSISR